MKSKIFPIALFILFCSISLVKADILPIKIEASFDDKTFSKEIQTEFDETKVLVQS